MAVGQVHGAQGNEDALQGGDQLVFSRYRGGQLVVAVSGRFSNGQALRRELKEHGALIQSTAEAELLAHLISHSGQRTEINRLVDALWKVEGGWCALVCTADKLVAVRGPRGLRSLWMGQGQDGSLWISTEETAIHFAGGTVDRELRPGEMAVVDAQGVHCVSPFVPRDSTACVQEFISLSGNGGRIFDHDVWGVRVGMGERLAREAPASRASVVVGIPGAGEGLAVGFGRVGRIPVETGLVRGAPSGQRLVQPPSGVDHFASRARWSVVKGAVRGRAVALVAPAILIGDDTAQIVQQLRDAGATEVHLRVASPPLRHACAYGVPTPTTDELSASSTTTAATGKALGVDTFNQLSLDGLHAVVGRRVDDKPLYCDACLSGRHPVTPEKADDQLPLF
jgi:amidophosphoribosyltransferase